MSAQGHVEIAGSERAENRNPLEAHAAFFADWLGRAKAALEDPATRSLTLVLAPASSEHDNWRRAVAGDLAREYAPKRVNIAAGVTGKSLNTLCMYLRDAPGVTGHYVQTHD